MATCFRVWHHSFVQQFHKSWPRYVKKVSGFLGAQFCMDGDHSHGMANGHFAKDFSK